MITVNALSKRFGQIEAVRGVSFSAPDGRITGLLGPNGAGKSTTLRMLATLLRPDSGDAIVDGQSATTSPIEVRRRIGVLSHASGLYPQLTARENILYFAELHGIDRPQARARISELANLLDIGDFLDRKTKGFSQGQRLKTALARALVHSPRNLILDEPTSGLEDQIAWALRALLTRLREQGHCIVFSSHVMQEVALLCDEVVVIAQGRVAAAGTIEALRSQAGESTLEDAFVKLIGTAEGLN